MAQFAADGVPTIDGCRPAVLEVMADNERRPLSQIVAAVASHLELSDEVTDQLLASGQRRLDNRVGWACSSFATAGLLTRERRGWYRITAEGELVRKRGLLEYSEKAMLEWPQYAAYWQELAERKSRAGTVAAEATPSAATDDEVDPFERVAELVAGLNNAVETQLRLQSSSSVPCSTSCGPWATEVRAARKGTSERVMMAASME